MNGEQVQVLNLGKLLVDHGFRLYSTVIWGAVIYQFHARYPLQGSLTSSMAYLHEDSYRRDAKTSWMLNLGSGGKYVPFAAIAIWAAKYYFYRRKNVAKQIQIASNLADLEKQAKAALTGGGMMRRVASFSENFF